MEKYFKPIIEPLKQIIENTVNDESQSIKKEVNVIKILRKENLKIIKMFMKMIMMTSG